MIVVRTVLSWTMVLEMDGHWPWQSSPPIPGGQFERRLDFETAEVGCTALNRAKPAGEIEPAKGKKVFNRLDYPMGTVSRLEGGETLVVTRATVPGTAGRSVWRNPIHSNNVHYQTSVYYNLTNRKRRKS